MSTARIQITATVQDGRLSVATIETLADQPAQAMAFVCRESVIPKADYAVQAIRRAIRLARIATGGRR